VEFVGTVLLGGCAIGGVLHGRGASAVLRPGHAQASDECESTGSWRVLPKLRSSSGHVRLQLKSRSQQLTYLPRLDFVCIVAISLCVLAGCYRSLPDTLDELVLAMGSSDMGTQAAAAERVDVLFGHTGLLEALHRGGGTARAQAARRLSRYSHTEVVLALIQVSENDEDRQARYAAIRALGGIGSERARPSLMSLKDDSDPLIREGARVALGQLDELQR